MNVTSVQRTGTGTYEVTFNSAVDISTAYLVASPGVNTTCAAIESVEPGSSGNYAFVLFVTDGGNPIDCAFSLLVFLPGVRRPGPVRPFSGGRSFPG